MSDKCLGCGRDSFGQSTANDMSIAFDIDETLVIWDVPIDMQDKTITFDNFGVNVQLLPHYKHIDQLKRHAARGHTVYVWSAGGREWAKEVIKVLGLEKYVYDVLCKFQFYYDDLTPQEFLPLSSRVYYDPKTQVEIIIEDRDDENGS